MKNLVSIIALCLGLLTKPAVSYAQTIAKDSIATKKLNEVVVEAQMQNVAPSVSTYIPSGNQKKSAQDAIDLLAQMAIPQITVNPVSNSLLTLNGKAVAVYIDMQPASQAQMEALRPEDVKKVEYLVYPTDPRYQHNPYVVSFILRRKEFGGYAKLTGRGNIMAGSGSGLAYGKMAYKRMTYDLLATDKYTDRSHQGLDNRQVFRLPDADGTEREITRDNIMTGSRLQQNNLAISFRATYATRKMTIANTLSVDATNRPHLNSSGSVVFTPGLFNRADYTSASSSKVMNPAWTGNFFFNLSHGYMLNAVTMLQYQDTRSNSAYHGAGNTSIVTDARDKAVNSQIMLQVNKAINDHHVVDLRGYYIYKHDKVDYTGTTLSADRFDQSAYGGTLGYTLQSGRFYGRLEGGIIGEWNRIDGLTMTDIVPAANLNMQHAFNRRHSLDLTATCISNLTDQSDKTPIMLRENELLYKTGNPDLKNTRSGSIDLQYTWLPNNRFQLAASGGWSRYFDRPVPLFTPDGPYGAMLRSIVNSGDCQNFDFGVSLTARLLNRSLVLQAQPRMWLTRLTGIYSDSYNHFSLTASATYYFKSFYAMLYYSTAEKGLVQYSLNYTFFTGHPSYNFRLGWRNSKWNISVSAINIFRRDWIDQTSRLTSRYFDQYSIRYSAGSHQNVKLTVNYIFGFGKKIRRGNEVQAVTSSGSAIMK